MVLAENIISDVSRTPGTLRLQIYLFLKRAPEKYQRVTIPQINKNIIRA